MDLLNMGESLHLLNEIPLPIFVSDLKGYYLQANQIASELSGFGNPSNMVGKHYSDLPSSLQNYADDFMKHDKEVLRIGNKSQFIQMFKYSDGKYHCHLGTKSVIQFNDEPLVQGCLFDITELSNPLVCEILSLNSIVQKNDDHQSFWYLFDEASANTSKLTPREISCIRYLMLNFTNKMISQCLNVSTRTIDAHIDNIKNKLGLHSKANIISHCIYHRLLPINMLFDSTKLSFSSLLNGSIVTN
jgi:DNA-binding CsgD family transcriptional regulator